MDDRRKDPGGQLPGLPIREDTAVEVVNDPKTGRPEIVSVKPIYRPPELKSKPIKPRWFWIWLTVIAIVVLAWLILYWYFSNHTAPYSAPLR
jgi:hypothetical protein